MKTRFLFIVLVLFALCFKLEAQSRIVLASSGDTIMVVCVETETLRDSAQTQSSCLYRNHNKVDSSFSHSDKISILTLATNTVNNVLTEFNNLFAMVTIIVGIITMFVAIVGLWGFHNIRKEVNDNRENVNKKIEAWEKEAEKLKKKNEEIEKVQILNNQYLQKINQWMLANAYSIADTPGGNTTQGRDMMRKSILNYYLMKLFLSRDKHEIDGCINYIKTKGGKDEIEHLQFIVDNDTDKYKSDRASEAIGYIQGRISSIS